MAYTNPQYLRDTDWLFRHLNDPELRIFDVTGMLTSKLQNIAREKCYDQGHIPGAVFLDMASAKGSLSDPNAAFPWSCPPKEQFENLMGRLGVTNDSKVVLYAATPRPGIDFGTMWSTRAWWIMHHFGVRVSVLDGGWEKWKAEQRPVSTEAGSYPAASFTADPNWQRGLATKEDVLSALGNPDSMGVINALSERSHAGTDPLNFGSRKGHITGSCNVPMASLLDQETGTFVNADAMRRLFEEAGALSKRKVITYCGGAIAATVDAFGLALIGFSNVAVYDNSLMEWTADPSLPMTDPSSESGG